MLTCRHRRAGLIAAMRCLLALFGMPAAWCCCDGSCLCAVKRMARKDGACRRQERAFGQPLAALDLELRQMLLGAGGQSRIARPPVLEPPRARRCRGAWHLARATCRQAVTSLLISAAAVASPSVRFRDATWGCDAVRCEASVAAIVKPIAMGGRSGRMRLQEGAGGGAIVRSGLAGLARRGLADGPGKHSG